jgi:hypothetical protein
MIIWSLGSGKHLREAVQLSAHSIALRKAISSRTWLVHHDIQVPINYPVIKVVIKVIEAGLTI